MPSQDTTRILRIAAWIWIGFLLAMLVMDFVLYTQIQPVPFNAAQQQMPPRNPQQDPLNHGPAPLTGKEAVA